MIKQHDLQKYQLTQSSKYLIQHDEEHLDKNSNDNIISKEDQFPKGDYSNGIILEEENLEKLRQIVLKVKVGLKRDLFIRKLKRNHVFKGYQIKQNKSKQLFCNLKGIQFNEKIQHLAIVLNLISIIILMILSGMAATLVQFSEKVEHSTGVVVTKFICLFCHAFHFFVKSMGYTYKNGQYLQYAYEIIVAYFSSVNSYIDITSILLLTFFIIYPSTQVLSAAIFAILVPLYLKAGSQLLQLESAYIHTIKMRLIWQLVKIMAFNFILAHIIGVILLGMSHFDSDHSWLVKYDIDGQPWYVLYASAYYWGTIIITTVGFGDISAGNWRQAIVVAVIALFACVLLGFNISQFTNIFSIFRELTHRLDHNKIIFKQLLIRDENNNAKIDPFLKRQISKYIQHGSFDKGDVQLAQRNAFIAELPQYLRNSYRKAAYKRTFKSVAFINELKHETLTELTEVFGNRILISQQQIPDLKNNIYILQEGRIGFTYKKHGSTINGMAFDSVSVKKKEDLKLLNSDFISMQRSSHFGLIAKNVSLIWSISIQSFINVLRTNEMDLQYYFNMLHKHSLNEDQWESIKCFNCSTKHQIVRHNAFRCPQITYMPFRCLVAQKFVSEFNHSIQPRGKYIRLKQHQLRMSVLKYYKNYFEALVQEHSKIQSQKIYISNFFGRKSCHSNNVRKCHMLSGERTYYDEDTKVLKTDVPQNFQYYFPQNNSCNLVSQPISLKSKRDYKQKSMLEKFHPYQLL